MMLSLLYKAIGTARQYGAQKSLSDNPDDTPEARERKKKKKTMNRTGVMSPVADLAAGAALERRARTRIGYGL